jgi:hypothetical protein
MAKFELHVKKDNTTLKLGVFDSYDEAYDFLSSIPIPEGVTVEISEVGVISLALRTYNKYRMFVGLD